ncbi:hypothetical protein G647_07092 [Cladophialophora carrionii CBS 160.54]|uniref:Zn(2)-C6 fungal-type domain-containing protein n=1 Tax=Cladophialophora carrionii CBS 160.54 TaxID=1279043 RepID=V9D1I4_9EURO|nr:uncharacterized protein G647_07092 [Cladophialophora carrionii CBS 160.54]ETI20750.1 hypothetical protein G647_07092 [Cladophialophora carrionii CBS 160.54]
MSRPRASHACRECRRKKLRCDLARPSCTRCASSGSPCVYGAGSSGSRDFQFVQTTFHGSRGESSGAGSLAATEEVALSTTRLRTLEEKLENLTAQVQALQGRNSMPSLIAAAGEPSADVANDTMKRVRTTESAASAEAMRESGAGHLLVQPGGRLRYVSRGHWAAMCEEAGEIEMLLRGQTRYDLPVAERQTRSLYDGEVVSAPAAWDKSQRVSSKSRQSSPLHTLQILDRSRADALFDAYISCFHPVVPLAHIPTLQRDYERVWDLQRSGGAPNTIQTMPLILAALYAGAVVYHHPSLQNTRPDTDIERVATEIHHEATAALHLAHFPRVPTVAGLAAHLILQGMWMRDEEPLSASGDFGVAVRVAQMLGLHKDPSRFKTTVAPVQAEVQRRVWWHVFHCDVLVAVASGLPPLIERSSWDTKMVSDLYEDRFGTMEGLQHDEESRARYLQGETGPDASPLASPLGIWLQGKFQDALSVRKLLDKAFHEDQMTIDDMVSARNDLQLLRRQLRARSQLIPIDSSNNTYEDNPQFNMWAKVLLTTLGDKNWWFLHTPLLHRSITQAWQSLIPNLQLYCCAFLEQYIILCCAQDFIRFHWSWPGNHQPLHALMLVLKEVERNPAGAEVEISCTVIDQTMALCAPEGGITASGNGAMMHRPLNEGGAEAWDLIRRLRARVWTKIGRDPEVILTRDDVESIVAQKLQAFKASGGILDLRTPLPSDVTGQFEQQPMAQPATSLHSGTSSFTTPLPDVAGDPGQFDQYTFGLGGGRPTPNINWDDWDQVFNTGYD